MIFSILKHYNVPYNPHGYEICCERDRWIEIFLRPIICTPICDFMSTRVYMMYLMKHRNSSFRHDGMGCSIQRSNSLCKISMWNIIQKESRLQMDPSIQLHPITICTPCVQPYNDIDYIGVMYATWNSLVLWWGGWELCDGMLGW